MKYSRHLNYHKRRRFLLKMRLFLSVLIVGFIGAIAYGYYTVVVQEQSNTQASTTSRQTSTFFASNVKVFKSPHFQFQANHNWYEVPAESSANKYVYRNKRNNLIEHDMIVYVNSIPPSLSATRVLPVNTTENLQLLPINVSEHCIKSAGGSRIDTPEIIVDRVRMKCSADNTLFSVIVGSVGGSTVLNLKKPDGSPIHMSILYTNLRATPEGSELSRIVETFQAR